MSRRSQDSDLDPDRIQARTQYTERYSSPDAPANRRAENDFVAVGAAFWDRRESDSRPKSLDLSEGEEPAHNASRTTRQAELFSEADAVVAGHTMPRRSLATTPTPTHPHYGSYIQPSDMAQVREIRNSRSGARGRYRGKSPFRHIASLRGTRHGSDPGLWRGCVLQQNTLFRSEAFYGGWFKKHATPTPVRVSISSRLYLERQPPGQLS
jgi:hypothetical protein